MNSQLRFVVTALFVSVICQSSAYANWHPANVPGPNIAINVLFASNGILYAGTDSGIFVSTNMGTPGGTTWMDANGNLPVDTINNFERFSFYAFAQSGSYVYAAGTCGVARSTDNGKTWNLVNNGLPQNPDFTDHWYTIAANGNMVAVGGNYIGLFISSDDGMDWSSAGGFQDSAFATIIFINNDIVVDTYRSIQVSADSGQHWVAKNNGLLGMQGGTLSLLTTRGNDLFVPAYFQKGATNQYGYGIFRSTNEGDAWVESDSGIGNVSNGLFCNEIDKYKNTLGNGTLFAMSYGSPNLYMTTDNGRYWQTVDSNYQGASPTCFTVFGEYIVIAYSSVGNAPSQVFRRRLSDFGLTAVNQTKSDLPAQFSLSQNYPNPFAGATMISYTLPEAGAVNLIVYNSLGEEVATLVHGENSAGEHSAEFNANNLQNGIYYYRLTAGKFSQTGKMAVVR